MKGTLSTRAIAYLALAVALGLVAQCGGVTTPTITPTEEAAPTPTPGAGAPAPTPPTGPFAAFAGSYSISATKTRDDGCNFSPTFGGRIVITLNPDGSNFRAQVVEQVTRTYTGSITTGGSFNASGSNNFLSFQTTGTLIGNISGNSITADETITFNAGCAPPLPKIVVYRYSGSK